MILEELDRSRPHIQRAIEMAKKVVAQGNEDEIEGKSNETPTVEVFVESKKKYV